jgi:hypothetical protein
LGLVSVGGGGYKERWIYKEGEYGGTVMHSCMK